MTLKENMLVRTYYSYILYIYIFFIIILSLCITSLLSEREGKCVAGRVEGGITTRDWEGTGEQEGKHQKIETEGKAMG